MREFGIGMVRFRVQMMMFEMEGIWLMWRPGNSEKKHNLGKCLNQGLFI